MSRPWDDGTVPQLTQEEAKAFPKERWEAMTPAERGAFQLTQQYLCMPFEKFHEGLEAALGRSVWTHEFGLNYGGLLAELNGSASAPSMAEIIRMLPADRTVLLAVPNGKESA